MQEIVLPETKPALEWINGRALQKVSPQRQHAVAQLRFGSALLEWAKSRRSGVVGTEWEFRIAPPGEIRRPLVPDVAYLSYDRIPFEDEDAVEIPRAAPNGVVEVWSPGDRKRDVDEKVRVYLAAGTDVIFLVDTDRRTVTARDRSGSTVFAEDDTICHQSLPGFEMIAARLFDGVRPKKSPVD